MRFCQAPLEMLFLLYNTTRFLTGQGKVSFDCKPKSDRSGEPDLSLMDFLDLHNLLVYNAK